MRGPGVEISIIALSSQISVMLEMPPNCHEEATSHVWIWNTQNL